MYFGDAPRILQLKNSGCVPEIRDALVWLLLVTILSGTALAVLKYENESTVGIGAIRQVSPWTYLLTESRVLYTYLRLLVFPFPQSLEYDLAWVHGLDLRTLAQVVGLLAFIGLGLYLARSQKWRITGLSIVAFFI